MEYNDIICQEDTRKIFLNATYNDLFSSSKNCYNKPFLSYNKNVISNGVSNFTIWKEPRLWVYKIFIRRWWAEFRKPLKLKYTLWEERKFRSKFATIIFQIFTQQNDFQSLKKSVWASNIIDCVSLSLSLSLIISWKLPLVLF